MATTELVRVKCEVKQELFTKENTKFLRRMKEVLGYEGMNPELSVNKTAAILNKLGIEPLDGNAVQDYKLALWREKNQEQQQSMLLGGWFHWEKVNLREYKKPVPAFALSRAAEVKKALESEGITPRLYVEELSLQSRTADPFLLMEVEDATFYLDVWDEPKFEGRRVK